MPWLVVAYLLTLFLGAAVALAVAVLAWRQRHTASYMAPLTVWMLTLTVWSVCYLLSLLSLDYAGQAFWFKALFLGSALMAPAAMVFALHFTGKRHWVTPRLLALLAVEPLISWILIATNDAHGLFWSAFGPAPAGAFPALAYTRGDWGQVRLFFIYLENAGAMLVLLSSLPRSSPLYRRQALGLAFATTVPWIASLLTTSGFSPLGKLDLTPGGLGLMIILWGIDMLRQGIFNVIPAARYAVIEDMQDAVFVVNAQARLVDANPEALRLLRRSAAACLGRPADEVFAAWPAVLRRTQEAGPGTATVTFQQDGGPEEQTYEFRVANWRNETGNSLGRLIVAQDITARRRAEEALARPALYDGPTALPNRTLLTLRLDEALQQAVAAGGAAALLIMDLNGFKDVNDTFGHHIGDVLLRQVGERLRAAAPPPVTAARLGGDEFAVVAPVVAGADEALRLAEHILKALEPPVTVEDIPLVIGASIGVTLYPDHGATASILMRRADVAMYAAKRGGGGALLYDPAADENSPGKLALVSELRAAIAAGALVLHYQPQVYLATGKMSGVEALVRWPRPGAGLLPPDEFITLAERSGLIQPSSR
ncbi:MAG: diguanylate cyclase [Chloroflexi bacterium]|nr:diguanylate cyclase [Chloroflexota bacterium]